MNNKTYFIGIIILAIIIGYWYFGQSKPKTSVSQPARIISADAVNNNQNTGEFLGEKGDTVIVSDNQLTIPVTNFTTNVIRYFNTEISGKTIYFMVVKDDQGVYRAAANACEVCFGARMGFTQEGDTIVCNNCQKRYALNTLGVVKGGCNPGPINPNLEIKDGQIIIKQTDFEQVSDLF